MRNNRADARRSLGANSDLTAFRESDVTLRSAVTVTVPAEAVVLRTKRLPQHCMVSYSAGDSRELFRWPWNGRVSLLLDRSLPYKHSARRSKSNGKPLHIPANRFPERVLRTVLITSIPVVVIVVENRAQNADDG